MKNVNRRDFIKTTCAGMLSATLFGYLDLYAAGQSPKSLGGLLNYMVLDDCAKLVQQTNILGDYTKFIQTDPHVNMPANLCFFGDMIKRDANTVWNALAQQIESLKQFPNSELSEDQQDDKDRVERKISLLMGWYLAAGIREVLDPVYAVADRPSDRQPTDMSIYHDMFVLRRRAQLSEKSGVDEVEALFNGFQPRMIARTHTLTPDYDDGVEWTVRISEWRDDSMQLMNAYAQAFVNPHPNKIKYFIDDMNFYNTDEALIQLVEKAQSGQVDDSSLNKSLDSAHCLYAKAVAAGVKAIQDLSVLLARID